MVTMVEILKRVYTCYQKSRGDWQYLDSNHKILNKARNKSLWAGGII